MLTVSETLDLLTNHPTMRIGDDYPAYSIRKSATLIGLPQYEGVILFGRLRNHQYEIDSFVIGLN